MHLCSGSESHRKHAETLNYTDSLRGGGAKSKTSAKHKGRVCTHKLAGLVSWTRETPTVGATGPL